MTRPMEIDLTDGEENARKSALLAAMGDCTADVHRIIVDLREAHQTISREVTGLLRLGLLGAQQLTRSETSPMMKAILFSGGLVSLSTLLTMREQVGPELVAVHVDTGSSTVSAERVAATRICERLGMTLVFSSLRDMASFTRSGSASIPYRDTFLAMAALARLEPVYGSGAYELWVGGCQDAAQRRHTPRTFEVMGEALSKLGTSQVQVRSVWSGHTRTEVVRSMVAAYGHKFEALARLTMSCYAGEQCGECAGCFESFRALEGSGVMCAHWYAQNPRESEHMDEIRRQAVKAFRDRPRRRHRFRVLQGGRSEDRI